MFVNQPDDAQLAALWHDPRRAPPSPAASA